MNLRTFLPLAAAVAALLLPAAADAAAPGVNIAGPPTPDRVGEAIATGAKTVRIFALWRDFEPDAKGQYPAGSPSVRSLSAVYDAGVRQLNAAGVLPVFVVTETPSWASGSPDVNVPPANDGDYADFLGRFVAHNRAAGLRVRGYEVWNEPDADVFWHPAADPARYAALLKAAYPAVKQADPSALVVAGPTTGNNYDWYHQLYANGARGFFDVAAVHTDTGCLVAGPDSYYRDAASGKIAQWSFLGYRSVHDEMVANGDGAKPIWMTELGWSSTNGGPTSCQAGMWAGQKASGVSEAQQATFLTKAFTCMANDSYLTDALWFTMRDTVGESRDELDHYGLVRADGSAKPALGAFRAVAAAGGGSAGPCGDFTPPVIRVVSPAPGQQFVDKIDVQAGASDAGVGMMSLTFSYDGGHKINTYGAARLAHNATVGLRPWFGSGKLGLGAHTIEITAVDTAGNTARQTIDVTKVKTLTSTLLPTLKLKSKKVACKRHVCRISGSLVRGKVQGPTIGGHVDVQWQFLNRKHKWRKLMGGKAQARKPFVFRAKLKRSGRWRVRVVYEGQAPWKQTSTRFVSFRVR